MRLGDGLCPGGHHSSAPLSTLPARLSQGCHSFVPNVCQVSDTIPDQQSEREHRRHLARSTAVFGVATGVSRVLGLVREIVAAYAFGAAGRINAFTIAFAIPNLVRALVADSALSGAFVPVFSELLEKGERVRAWRVASTILWLILLITGAMTAVFILIAPLVIGLFGDPGGDLDLAVALSRILFPIVVLLGLSGVVVGILNSYDEFTIPALTPVAWNLVIILGLAIGIPSADGDEAELYWYAGAIVVATFVQLLLPLPWLRGLDGRLRLAFDWRDPAVKKFLTLMLPVTLALGLININTLIGMAFASRLIDPELAPRAIDLAFRLYMLPQGIFSVAVATVLFPTLSRLAARRDMRGFGQTLDTGIRQIGFLLIPAGVVSAVLAEPIVRLVYERGAFTPDQTPVVAGALAAFSIGLVFNGWMLMLNRAYYGLQSNWVPTLVALGNLAVERGSQLRPLSRRGLGAASGHLDCEPDRRGGIARAPAPPGAGSGRARHRSRIGEDRRRLRSRCGGGLRRVVGRRRSPRTIAARRARLRGSRARLGDAGLPARRARPGDSGARSTPRAGSQADLEGVPDKRNTAPRLRSGDPWTRATFATSRSSPTSTMGSRRLRIGSSSSPTRWPTATCATSCSTRWISSASAGSPSRRRPYGCTGRGTSST